MRIDRDEYEAIRAELVPRDERKEGDVVITSGSHEDLGEVTLRREQNVFTVAAEDASYVRPWGERMPETD